MLRRITGFSQDAAEEWVAQLSCLHGQHVRHHPPFQERPWIRHAAERQERVGTSIDCPLCDRAEMPDGLQVARTAGPFDGATLPAGLRRTHQVAEGTWATLRVLRGDLGFWMATAPPTEVRLRAGDRQAIPPGVPHRLLLDEPAGSGGTTEPAGSGGRAQLVELAVDFLVPARPDPALGAC